MMHRHSFSVARPFLTANLFRGKSTQATASPTQTQTEGEHSGPLQTLTADLFFGGQNAPDGRNTFAVIGDSGTGDPAQSQVARQMMLWRQKLPFNTVLALGDNVYPAGEPSLFQGRIQEPYQSLLQAGVRFFPVLGNHDVKAGFGDQQLAYWGVPAHYNLKLGRPGQDVEIFALDTTVMVPGYYGGFQDDPAVSAQKEKTQRDWLENALASSTASMKIVMGHYPLFSKGANAKVKRLVWQHSLEQKLAPVLERYQVDLYLAGHEHHYEAPCYRNGVRYVVSGAAGKLDAPTKGVPEGNGVIKRNHFMLFENTATGLNYRVISEQGDLLDFGMVPRKRNPFS